jgi:hypothetical protein
MSEAVELYKADGSTAGIFYCSECRVVFRTKDEAQLCHGEKICDCGNKIEDRFYAKCRVCQGKEQAEQSRQREAARYEKANKIQWSDYKGGMILDGDDYYEDLESALDRYEEGQEPEYVWACKDIGVAKLYAEDIVQNIIENMWEDADCYDLNGMAELDAACEAFNKANESISVWEPDYSTAILVPREESE